MMDLLKKFDKNFNATGRTTAKSSGPYDDDVMKRRQDRWNSCSSRECGSRTCSITTSAARAVHHPLRTQEGEISFCAYNTGVGWRNISRRCHDRHAHQMVRGARASRNLRSGKNVKMDSVEHALFSKMSWLPTRNSTISTSWYREELARRKDAGSRRQAKEDPAYNARMAALYREVVLKEKRWWQRMASFR